MKKQPNPYHIVLIRPPFSLSGTATASWAKLLAHLKPLWPNLKAHDAANDYLVEGLASIKQCGKMMERLSGEPPLNLTLTDTDREFITQIRRRYPSAKAAQELSHDICSALKRLASPDPDRIVSLAKDINLIDGFLSVASAAYHPCRFQRHGFAHDGLNDKRGLLEIRENTTDNPFWHYTMHRWEPFAGTAPPDLALLYVDQPGQVIAAATMAAAWQTRWPANPLRLLGPGVAGISPLNDLFADTSSRGSSELKTCFEDIEKAVEAYLLQGSDPAATGNQGSLGSSEMGTHLLIADQMPEKVQEALEKGDPLMVWRPGGEEVEPVTQQLYQASRQGIWNHLILKQPIPAKLESFAAANANIVHSYCYEEEAPSAFSDSSFRFPVASPAYGKTKPLPGQPLWMALKDTALIEALLARYDLKALIRMRIRDDGESLFEVGKHIVYHFDKPGDLPKGHLDEIVKMVAAGGSVNTQFVKHNLERAFLIAYVEEEGVIVGNSSLKRSREEYMDAVSQQSGIDLHNFLERGYTSVRPDYRGLGVGAKLLEGLTQRAGEHKIFSVIAESNIATQKMAMRNRTRRVATFFSERAKKEVGVWIPEWMIPEGIVLPRQPDEEAGRPGKKEGA